MVTVLVTDPEQRAALAAVRSLARRGWRVVTIGTHRGLAGISRSTFAHVSVPADEWRTPAGMVRATREAVIAHKVRVVLPVTDMASRALLGAEDVAALKAGPSASAYARASDKSVLMDMAPQLGIRVPAQHVLRSPTDRPAAPLHDGAWVIKPARSVVDVDGQSVSLQVRFASGWMQAMMLAERYPAAAYPLMVQERIWGNGIGVFLLRHGGTSLLRFGHRRLREKPPAGGVSTYREAIEPPPEVIARCEALLDKLQYQGPAMIEFKEDQYTGEAVLMEINARLWGSVQLAIDAGVDFPAALVASTLGEAIPEAPVVRLGTRTWWELGELDHALAIWRKSAGELSAPPGMAIGFWAALRALCDRQWSDRPEVFRFSDPMPFMMELLRWIRRQ